MDEAELGGNDTAPRVPVTRKTQMKGAEMGMRTRIVRYRADDHEGVGVVRDDGLVDLARLKSAGCTTLLDLASASGPERLLEACGSVPLDYRLAEIDYLPPLPECRKILCVGVNYPARAAEYGSDPSAPSYPSLFPRFPGSFVGHGQSLVRPSVSEQLDYEGEIAIVIGKRGRHIPEKDALEHVFALTLCNEGSVRDWMRHGKFNVTQGKNFDRSGAVGPWLTLYEDESQIADIQLTTRVNGEVRQQDRTGRMLFGFRRIINYISTFTTLDPGDVIVTGTPTGAGARHNPPVWLKPGDTVEVEAEGLGILRNNVVDEADENV